MSTARPKACTFGSSADATSSTEAAIWRAWLQASAIWIAARSLWRASRPRRDRLALRRSCRSRNAASSSVVAEGGPVTSSLTAQIAPALVLSTSNIGRRRRNAHRQGVPYNRIGGATNHHSLRPRHARPELAARPPRHPRPPPARRARGGVAPRRRLQLRLPPAARPPRGRPRLRRLQAPARRGAPPRLRLGHALQARVRIVPGQRSPWLAHRAAHRRPRARP